MLHAELLPVSGSGLGDLSRDRLEDYLTSIVGDNEIPAADGAWGERLCGLGFMAVWENRPPVCTVAGLLLFGHRPRRLLSQAGVRWMAFDGPDRTYRALDDRVVDGPLVALRSGAGGRREVAGNGLIGTLVGLHATVRVRGSRSCGRRHAPAAAVDLSAGSAA